MSNKDSSIQYYDNFNLPRNSKREIVIVIDGGPKDLVPLPEISSNFDPNKIPLYPGLNPQNTPTFTLPPGAGSPMRPGRVAYDPKKVVKVVGIASFFQSIKNIDTKINVAIKTLPKNISELKNKANSIMKESVDSQYTKDEEIASLVEKLTSAVNSLNKSLEEKNKVELEISDQKKLADKKFFDFNRLREVKLQNFEKFLNSSPEVYDAAFNQLIFPSYVALAKKWGSEVDAPHDKLLLLKNKYLTFFNLIINTSKDVEDKTLELEKKTNEIKDSVKFTTDFYKETFQHYGEKAEKLANNLASQAKGKNIKNVDDALKAYEKYQKDLNKKINTKDREAIAKAIASVDAKNTAENFKKFSKGMGYVSKVIDAADLLTELTQAVKTDNWRPFLVKLESMAAGAGASAAAGFAFSVLLGGPIGIIGYALIMAVIGALIDDELIESANKLLGI